MKAGTVRHAIRTETQLKDGKCPDCGRKWNLPRKRAIFRLSKYQTG